MRVSTYTHTHSLISIIIIKNKKPPDNKSYYVIIHTTVFVIAVHARSPTERLSVCIFLSINCCVTDVLYIYTYTHIRIRVLRFANQPASLIIIFSLLERYRYKYVSKSFFPNKKKKKNDP